VKSNKPLIVLLFLLTSHVLFAQQQKISLRTVLHTLEQRYTVSFTFLDEVIEGIIIETPAAELSLREALDRLAQQTGLVFTQLDEHSITINQPSITHVCGYIMDKDTREKIPGAVVQVSETVVVTDHNGYFSFDNVSAKSFVVIKSLGYDSMQIRVSDLSGVECKPILLTLRTSVLSELVITNYLTVGIQKKAEGSVTIQTNELGLLPGLTEPDVLFTIQALPGIQSIDETVSNINVRGGTHDQNLVLWDGIKMYQQGHFFGLISAFNPYFTKEVNLIKNGTSAFYSDGVSSTIDIHADDEVAKKFSGGAGLNMVNADVYAKIPLSKKSSLHFATRRSIADVAETPTYKSYYERAFRGTEIEKYASGDSLNTNQKFHFYDISSKFLYDITPKDKLRLNFLMIHNSIDYQETELVNNEPESKISSLEQQNLAGSISYARQWNNKVRTSAMGYVSHYNLNAVNNDILNQQQLLQENEVLESGVKVDTRFTLSKLSDLSAGYQFFEVGVGNLEDIDNPVFYRFTKEVLRSHVVFSEWNYSSLNAATNIRAGIRANYFSTRKKIRVEPRLALTQKLGESFSVEILSELKSQTTTQVIDFQNDFLGVEKRRWVMADGDSVPMIKSEQVSAGLHFHKKDFLIVLEGYGKWVNDIITSSQGFQNQFQYVWSAGKYTTTGIDFLINQRVDKFNFWASYSFARTTYQFTALVPPTFPSNLDIRHRATAGLSYRLNEFELSTGLNWRTGKPFTEPVSESSVVDGEIQYQSPNSSRLPSYWRLDVSAKYKFRLSEGMRAIVGISVWNILNHDNIIDAYYQVNNSGEIEFFQRNALGMTPNAMIRVEF
jgi:outer membrane receptor protein involved in Fe transport